jgi:hypothetical protein
MRFMNDYDIQRAVSRFTQANKPNRLGAALVIANLAEWADTVSDGWHSWPKPCRAAEGLIRLVESTTHEANQRQEDVDATDAELAAAVKPVKAFLTRMAKQQHGLYPGRPMVTADERERILRSTT